MITHLLCIIYDGSKYVNGIYLVILFVYLPKWLDMQISIKYTVSINEDIASGIRSGNEEFSNITNMVQSNTDEILAISQQVDSTNGMTEK